MLLEVNDLDAGYGRVPILRGVSIEVASGEFVAILGPNGAGKTTLLRTISRYATSLRSGSMTFAGADIVGAPPQRLVRLGCVQVPEGRHLFTELTVEDNLRLGAFVCDRRTIEERLSEAYDRFPSLRERRKYHAYLLSGGEQQMLAVARALMARPKLLMLDEPSTGLAPQVVEQLFEILSALAEAGTAVLVVEQNAHLALQHANRAYILERGEIALEGPASALRADDRVRNIYLGAATDE